jgi:hypothetical protein
VLRLFPVSDQLTVDCCRSTAKHAAPPVTDMFLTKQVYMLHGGGGCRASITVGLVEHRVRSGRLHRGPASSTIHDAKVRGTVGAGVCGEPGGGGGGTSSSPATASVCDHHVAMPANRHVAHVPMCLCSIV